MDKRSTIQQLIINEGLLPLFYHHNTEVCLSVTKALYKAGVRIIEFTNRGAKALENFKAMVEERDKSMPGLMLAIGTIKTPEHAAAFIDAGADVLISPTFDAGVCDIAYINKILWIPGCMTPTEIQVADNAGCSLIKLFPGNVLGTSYIPAIKPLFPGLSFVVTGGVDTSEQNITEWLRAGASGLGMGSKLITNAIIENENYDEITTAATNVLQAIQRCKKGLLA